MFATGTADIKFCIFEENRRCARNAAHPTSEKGKFAVLTPGRAGSPNRAKRSEGSDTPPVRNTPVSPCKPLCAILLAKASVYPLLLVKANVGRFCEKLKNALKSGLEQRCNSNFLAIFVEVILWFLTG